MTTSFDDMDFRRATWTCREMGSLRSLSLSSLLLVNVNVTSGSNALIAMRARTYRSNRAHFTSLSPTVLTQNQRSHRFALWPLQPLALLTIFSCKASNPSTPLYQNLFLHLQRPDYLHNAISQREPTPGACLQHPRGRCSPAGHQCVRQLVCGPAPEQEVDAVCCACTVCCCC